MSLQRSLTRRKISGENQGEFLKAVGRSSTSINAQRRGGGWDLRGRDIYGKLKLFISFFPLPRPKEMKFWCGQILTTSSSECFNGPP